jgi:outer membrane protein assembly complex protein YaeT
VTPHEKIEIVVQGADIPKDLLKPLWEARVFEEWALREGEAKIITYLRERNYLFPFVSSSIKREKNSLRVIYDVVPGERHRVQDIQLKGARYFTPTQIKEKLGIPERIPFLSKISGARLYELPREIEFLYRMEGFSETKVDLNFLRQQKTVRPILYIKEGKQDTIARLSIEGFRLFTRKQLLDEINSHEGGAFFRPNVQKDIQKLEVFYMNQGVRGSNIRVLVRQESESGYDVRFQIEEGRKVKIENVVISGNEVTQTSIISRELLVKEGDLAFFDAIRTTKRRLEGLGVFSQIKIEEIPVSQDRINLLISLIEGRRNYASLGLGIETKNTPRSFAVWDYVIRPRGTAEFIRSNIFGFAGQLSLVGQVSLREQRAVASWEQPYFFGMPMQMVVNAWLEREERESYSFDRRGISLSTFRSLSSKEEMVFLTTFRFARTTLFELFVAESEVDRQHFPFSTTSVSGSFIWDRRDDPFNPEKGFFFSSVLEWAYPLFNAESNYQRTFSKYQHHIPVFPGITFITTTRLGLGRGRMPIHERFFAGGSNSFRGVKFDKLGPKDPDSFKPVGGKALLLFNLELAFPILSRVKNLFGIVFFDKGNVFERRKQVSWAALQDAVGFGIRYRTPLGPIRFELGWNLDAPAGERKPLVFITIGNVF